MKYLLTIFAVGGLLAAESNAQTSLSVGQLSFTQFNADAPDGFAFVPWVDLAANTTIKFSDFSYNGGGDGTGTGAGGGTWRANENFMVWTTTTAISAGTVITVLDPGTPNATVSNGSATGRLSGLSAGGDQIFAYQGSGTGSNFSGTSAAETFSGTLVFGLNYRGDGSATGFLTTGTATSNTSYLPSPLNVTNGNIVFGTANAEDAVFNGSRSNLGTILGYRSQVNASSNWTVTSSNQALDGADFTAVPEPQAYGLAFAGLLVGLVMLRWRKASANA